MPTYGYLCGSCDRGFEIEMTIREKETLKVVCPSCGSEDVAQQILGFSVSGAKRSGKGPAGCCPPGRGGCCG